MEEKPELLSLSTSVRCREQKASTSKTSSSCVHMRPGRAKYDAALLQCFCHVFAHIIKFFELQQEMLEISQLWRQNDVSEGAICMFLLLPSWIMASWAAKTSDKLRVAQLLSALQSPVARGFFWVFLSQFLTELQLENRTGSFALQMPLYILYFFIGINSFSNLFWEHLLLFL